MNNSLIKEYYLKLLAKYSLLPTFLIILLLAGTFLIYDRIVLARTQHENLLRNKDLAEQIVKNFTRSTGMISRSSFSSVALRFGDFSGYRSVVVPWISDDKSILGLIMFDHEGKVVLTWPSGLAVDKISKNQGVQVSGDKLIFFHEVVDNNEKLGALAFVTDVNALGLSNMNLVLGARASITCERVSGIDGLSVCPVAAGNDKLLFSVVTILFSVLGLIGVFLFSIARFAGFLSKPVDSILLGLHRVKNGESFDWKIFEADSLVIFRPIAENILDTMEQVKELNANLIYRSKISEMAKKLAHDIRSPLSALNVVARTEAQTPEVRELTMAAVKRINDISLELLKTAKSEMLDGKSEEITNINRAIREIVTEKKVQFGGQPDLQIRFQNDIGDCYVFIDEADFKSSLSNLINNSVEAMQEKGSIDLRLKGSNGSCQLEIVDQGQGFPAHVLAKLGQTQVSHGKEHLSSGLGLGLFNAFKLIERARGKIEIDSKNGVGAKIKIELPYASQSFDI